MKILLSDNFERKTLSDYLDKLNEIDKVLEDILSGKIEISDTKSKTDFISIKEHLKEIDYSTQYVMPEIAQLNKEERLRIAEFKENTGLKYYLLYLSMLNTFPTEEQFQLNRTLMGLNIYQSTFDKFLRFQDKIFLNNRNKK